MLDRRHPVVGEEFGKQAHHHFAVLEHVRDAGGNAQIVLEHEKFAGAVAHDVDAGDVSVNAPGHVDALHLRTVLRVAENLLGRDQARFEYLLVVVNVVDECIERANALLQAALEPDPLLERQDARHDIEGDQSLCTFFLPVHGEGNADAVEQGIRFGALLRQPRRGLASEPLGIALVVRAGGAIAQHHFVIRLAAQTSPYHGSRAKFVPSAQMDTIMYLHTSGRKRCTKATRGPPGPGAMMVRQWPKRRASAAAAPMLGSPAKRAAKSASRVRATCGAPPPATAIWAICSVAAAVFGRNDGSSVSRRATTSRASPLRLSASSLST